MEHLLIVAVIVLAVWAVLALPLGVLVGRRLRRQPPARRASSVDGWSVGTGDYCRTGIPGRTPAETDAAIRQIGTNR